MGEAIRYAGFWRRLAASLIDTLLLGLILTPLVYLFTSGHYLQSSDLENPQALLARIDWGYLLIHEALPLLLVIFFWVRYEATPGKMLLDCHVVDAESFGPLTIKQSVLRYLGYFISTLPLGLGFLWIAIDKRKRGFHDMIAGSVVVIRHQTTGKLDESEKSLEQLMRECK